MGFEFLVQMCLSTVTLKSAVRRGVCSMSACRPTRDREVDLAGQRQSWCSLASCCRVPSHIRCVFSTFIRSRLLRIHASVRSTQLPMSPAHAMISNNSKVCQILTLDKRVVLWTLLYYGFSTADAFISPFTGFTSQRMPRIRPTVLSVHKITAKSKGRRRNRGGNGGVRPRNA